MAGPLLATQRKNKPTITPSGPTVIVEQDENLFLPSTLSLTDASSSLPPVVPSNPTAGGTVVEATVYWRFRPSAWYSHSIIASFIIRAK
jgi:hypothetical protein